MTYIRKKQRFMSMRLFCLLLLVIVTTASNCKKKDALDIRDYYFQLSSLHEGLVYEYRDTSKASLSPDYWFYRSIKTDTAIYFTKAYYQNDFLPRTLYREKLVNNGILLQDLFLFETDSSGQQTQAKAEVLSSNVFPFNVKKESDEFYIYQVRFQLPSQPHGSTSLLINRRFEGDTIYQWQKKSYPAISFSIRGHVDQRDSILGAIEPQFQGREIYAKGLGLVYYERNYGTENTFFRHQLVDYYPMAELEKQAQEYWQ